MIRLEKSKRRSERKQNKERRNELEKRWKNLIKDEEKLFYDPCHFSALEYAVNEKLKDKNENEIKACLIEVDYLYRQSVAKMEASSQISIPSILAMISGAFLVYSIMFQMPINEKYDIKKVQDGFQLIIPNGDVGRTFLLLIIVLAVVFLAVIQMSRTSTKNNQEVCYYKNLLKLLNDKKENMTSREETESNVSNDLLKRSLGLVIILQYITNYLKRK